MTLADYPTFVGIRTDTVASAVLRGCYSEGNMPLLLHDYNRTRKADSVDMTHGHQWPLVKFNNFDLALETYSTETEYTAPITTNWDGGVYVPVWKNPVFEFGETDWTVPAISAFSSATKFITPHGVIDATYVVDSAAQVVLSRAITAAEIAPYKGRRLYFGALIYQVDMTYVYFQVLIDDEPGFFKRAWTKIIDYGNNWGLYVLTCNVANNNASDWSIQIKTDPENITTSDVKVAGMWTWINGIETFPVQQVNRRSDYGTITSGIDGANQGTLTLWDGAGGVLPGYILMYSPNGTANYFFVEDDGTLKRHTAATAAPTANGDGTAVGDQTD
jgi:hypothetical protein